jgi:hypothetical protein
MSVELDHVGDRLLRGIIVRVLHKLLLYIDFGTEFPQFNETELPQFNAMQAPQ